MSYHYQAGQYNGPFKPARLQNWTIGVNPYPGAFPGCPRRYPTTFIADKGHLLPHVYRNACTSPWGDYRTCIWEQPVPSSCVDQLRNPHFYKHQQQPCSVIVCNEAAPAFSLSVPASKCGANTQAQVYGSPRSSSCQPVSEANACTATPCPPAPCCGYDEPEPQAKPCYAGAGDACPVANAGSPTPKPKSVKSQSRQPSKPGSTC